jgi:glucose/arabinose dehydrogenase
MTFHPSFTSSGDVFFSYTVSGMGGTPLTSIISSFHMAPGGTIDPSSENLILSVDQPETNHNGGCLAFGPDDFLYIGIGDGGGRGDPFNNGQDTTTLPGSILRINVDGGSPYVIPAGNVFAGSSTDRPEIYAWGLRNPWRFSFDRVSGDLWVGDVGQNAWEEIDIIMSGGNYGWNILEGNHCYPADPCDDMGLVPPFFEYSHDGGDRSVTGGYVYHGNGLPSLAGMYIFGDYVSGRIWAVETSGSSEGSTLLDNTSLKVVSFAEDRSGELYVVDFNGGLYRIVPLP